MIKSRQLQTKDVLAKAVAAALLGLASLSANATLLVTGNTRPTVNDTSGIGVDGTVLYAVFEAPAGACGSPCMDPWGAGGGLDLTKVFLNGRLSNPQGGGLSPDLDTTAKYLYVYETYNSENNVAGGNTDWARISLNNVNVAGNTAASPDFITSWGAFQKDPTTGGNLGTYIAWSDPTKCPPAAANNAPSNKSDCTIGVGGTTATIAQDPGNPAFPTTGGSLDGFPTYGGIKLLTELGKTNAAVILDGDSLAAAYDQTNASLLGSPSNGSQNTLTDRYQFGTVWYLTSNYPPVTNRTTIAGALGTSGNGLVPVPGVAPEPAMLGLLGSGLLLLGWSRRGNKKS